VRVEDIVSCDRYVPIQRGHTHQVRLRLVPLDLRRAIDQLYLHTLLHVRMRTIKRPHLQLLLGRAAHHDVLVLLIPVQAVEVLMSTTLLVHVFRWCTDIVQLHLTTAMATSK
jgi:hypothetical protein